MLKLQTFEITFTASQNYTDIPHTFPRNFPNTFPIFHFFTFSIFPFLFQMLKLQTFELTFTASQNYTDIPHTFPAIFPNNCPKLPSFPQMPMWDTAFVPNITPTCYVWLRVTPHVVPPPHTICHHYIYIMMPKYIFYCDVLSFKCPAGYDVMYRRFI